MWAYRTTVRTVTGETPFSLVYGTEAILLSNMELSRSKEMESKESNFAALEFERVTVEEKREAAQRRAEAY